jgi:hypothetical protein
MVVHGTAPLVLKQSAADLQVARNRLRNAGNAASVDRPERTIAMLREALGERALAAVRSV